MDTTIRKRLDRESAQPCVHPAPTYIGSNQGTEFRRCDLCGAVIVRQANRVWVVPPRPSSEPAN